MANFTMYLLVASTGKRLGRIRNYRSQTLRQMMGYQIPAICPKYKVEHILLREASRLTIVRSCGWLWGSISGLRVLSTSLEQRKSDWKMFKIALLKIFLNILTTQLSRVLPIVLISTFSSLWAKFS